MNLQGQRFLKLENVSDMVYSFETSMHRLLLITMLDSAQNTYNRHIIFPMHMFGQLHRWINVELWHFPTCLIIAVARTCGSKETVQVT